MKINNTNSLDDFHVKLGPLTLKPLKPTMHIDTKHCVSLKVSTVLINRIIIITINQYN